jgi:hypothetical protein
MTKRTIFLVSVTILLVGLLVLKEYFDNNAKKKEELQPTKEKPDIEVVKMTEPRPEENSNKIIVNATGAVTFLLTANDVIYYYKGDFTGLLIKTDYKSVNKIIKKYKAEINTKDLMFVIKSGPGATFKNAIDLLDEMAINNVPRGHYMETDIPDIEINAIKKYNEN